MNTGRAPMNWTLYADASESVTADPLGQVDRHRVRTALVDPGGQADVLDAELIGAEDVTRRARHRLAGVHAR